MWKLAVALMLVGPAPALACSPETRPTQAEIDGDLRATFASASDLVDYVVVQRATSARKGAIRVTRSYKGVAKAGTILSIWTTAGAASGSGDAERGIRGRMFLRGKAPFQYRNLPDAHYDDFSRLKLVPAR